MTTDVDPRCLDTFPEWLRTLGADVLVLVDALGDASAPESARRCLAGALNYLFKSVDLIPDGIDDIGYLDDAFVLRVASAQALSEGLSRDAHAGVAALADDAALVKSFLGAESARLDTYVTGLRKGNARGRTVDAIVGDDAVRADLGADAKGFASGYSAPTFAREERTLVKLRAFFDARLPR